MNSATITREEIAAGLQIVRAVADSIKELGTSPAGPLYAVLMGRGVTLAGFEQIISILTRAGLVAKHGDMLTWTGPA